MDVIIRFQGVYRFLSNFYPSPYTPPTLEHRYQAAKMATTTGVETIMHCVTPGEAKRRAKILPQRPDWDTVKEEVMWILLHEKFRDPSLMKLLHDTGDTLLIEGNQWHDNYWGVCWCDHCAGFGKNILGNMLMTIRKES